ncbi:MAG TPA: SDR family NAD(P)-dependent oxidoreductase [Thermoplasmataceae archaeon]|nr:SDR family NAD(P)-dependent oxidoreductase [Thermoplasmataceae archaeon]
MAKTVVVTGGSRGLGKALSDLFFRRGWNVVTFSRSSDELEIRDGQALLLSKRADIRLERDMINLTRLIGDRFRGPKLLILNAGTVTPSRPFVESDVGELRRLLETNVIGNSLLLSLFLRLPDTIGAVHITSDAASHNYPGWGFYGATKGAMDHIIANIAVETGGKVFLSVDPGDMDTEMHRTAEPGADRRTLKSPEKAAVEVYDKIMGALKYAGY